MKAILSGIVVALAVAAVAALVLNEVQKPSYEVYTTQSVRVGEPGDNLVRWGTRRGGSGEGGEEGAKADGAGV